MLNHARWEILSSHVFHISLLESRLNPDVDAPPTAAVPLNVGKTYQDAFVRKADKVSFFFLFLARVTRAWQGSPMYSIIIWQTCQASAKGLVRPIGSRGSKSTGSPRDER